jgi:hypothetical protein
MSRARQMFSFDLEGCKVKLKGEAKLNYINKLQACCLKKNLAIGTENGKVYLFDPRLQGVYKCVVAEPWVSSLENCKGFVWASGISRSLMCIRVKDNKKIFHTNTNTEFHDYDSKGILLTF